MVSTVKANTERALINRIDVNYTYNNAVNFIENGIEFYIFTNGDFDFNQIDAYYDYNGARINHNNHLRIERNFRGRISRIENIFIRYDFRGNVTRIGNVVMGYYRNRLTRVGDLSVRYDSYGYPIFYGNVRDFYYHNGVRISINFGDVCDYNDAYFFHNDFRLNYNQFREDANFYYYRANTNAKIGKRSTILKRRKPASTILKNRDIKRNSNNSYRKPTNDRKDIARENNSRNQVSNTNRNTDRVLNGATRRTTNDRKEDSRTATRNLDSNLNRNYDSNRNATTSRNATNEKRAETDKDTRRNTAQRAENTTRNKNTDKNNRSKETVRRKRN